MYISNPISNSSSTSLLLTLLGKIICHIAIITLRHKALTSRKLVIETRSRNNKNKVKKDNKINNNNYERTLEQYKILCINDSSYASELTQPVAGRR